MMWNRRNLLPLPEVATQFFGATVHALITVFYVIPAAIMRWGLHEIQFAVIFLTL